MELVTAGFLTLSCQGTKMTKEEPTYTSVDSFLLSLQFNKFVAFYFEESRYVYILIVIMFLPYQLTDAANAFLIHTHYNYGLLSISTLLLGDQV